MGSRIDPFEGRMVMAGGSVPGGIPRRSFLKYATLGGLAAFGAYSGLVYPSGWARWLEYGRKPWELAPGVVDYDIVKKESWGPPELGFRNDIRKSPPEARILNVAQWYDYWPGKVLNDFSVFMERVWKVPGVKISWTSNIYTSNDELFTWITQTGRKFDLMFPSDSPAQAMEKAGQLANMNKEWLPNYVNMFGTVPTTFPEGFQTVRPEFGYWADEAKTIWVPTQPEYPRYPNGYNNAAGVDFRDTNLNGYAYRGNKTTYPLQKPHPDGTAWSETEGLIAVPYQWGTTGIGYRTDIFDKDDIEELGWEVFELREYNGHSLFKKKMMLDDMRFVFTAALKAAGWKRQLGFRAQELTTADPIAFPKYTGPTPTGSTPATYADSPFNGDFQWSANEVDDDRLQAASGWLQSLPEMWGFNTPQQGPFLIAGVMYVDHAWSGDIMYAVRPASNLHLPVDYFVPKQGGDRWIDNAAIHRECERLWLAHEFINFLCDARAGATISNWNFYASPNAWSFELLGKDPIYRFEGRYPNGDPYQWVPAADQRIYSDIAIGIDGDRTGGTYLEQGGEPILARCEYIKDVGVKNTLKYFSYWRQVKF